MSFITATINLEQALNDAPERLKHAVSDAIFELQFAQKHMDLIEAMLEKHIVRTTVSDSVVIDFQNQLNRKEKQLIVNKEHIDDLIYTITDLKNTITNLKRKLQKQSKK